MPNNRIAVLRREHGMNQKELGEQLGVAQTTVSAWETGKTEPDGSAMAKMSNLFHVSIGYLMGYEPESHTRGLSQEDYDALIRRRREEDDRKELEKIVKESERDPELEETVDEYFRERDQKDFESGRRIETLEGFLASRLIDDQSITMRQWLYHMLQELVKTPKEYARKMGGAPPTFVGWGPIPSLSNALSNTSLHSV